MNPVFEFDGGVGDTLIVYEDRVIIKHKGVLNFMAMGIHGDKTIYYADLTAVQFKKPGITNGHIQFSILGGRESVGGVLAASSDENTITFTEGRTVEAERICEYINDKIRAIKTGRVAPVVVTPTFSAADELLKYKQLLDAGVLSQDEFDAKKRELLGGGQAVSSPAPTSVGTYPSTPYSAPATPVAPATTKHTLKIRREAQFFLVNPAIKVSIDNGAPSDLVKDGALTFSLTSDEHTINFKSGIRETCVKINLCKQGTLGVSFSRSSGKLDVKDFDGLSMACVYSK